MRAIKIGAQSKKGLVLHFLTETLEENEEPVRLIRRTFASDFRITLLPDVSSGLGM